MGRNLLETLRFNTAWNMATITAIFLIVNYVIPYDYLTSNPGSFVSIHIILEFISVLVALSIGTIVWLMCEGFDNYYGKFVLLLGLSFFAVGIVDIMQILSYNGMPTFITPSSQQKALFFHLYARYLVASGFLVALLCPKENVFCLRKAIYILGVFSSMAIITAVLLGTKYINLIPLRSLSGYE